MRRRIDCNYIAFLRHVFDKSKYRTRDPRTEKMVREDQAIRLIFFIADLAVRGSLDGTFYFEQTIFFSRDQAKRHLREQNAVAIGRNGRNSGRGCFSNGLSMLDDLGNFNCNQVPSFVRTGK